MAINDQDDPALKALFAEARGFSPEPPDDLLARILADADAATRERAAGRTGAAPAPRPGWLAALLGALGGWPALGGLAASTVLGLLLGVAQPPALADLPASLWGEQVSVTLGLDEDPLSWLEG